MFSFNNKTQDKYGGGYRRETIWCTNKRGQNIYGNAYLPDGEGPFPLVVFSHGFGYTVSFIEADRLASAGIAVYEFEFCSGSPRSRSDGKTYEMSVMTEATDLEGVLDCMMRQPFVDNDKIYLSGGSQGGYVSIVVGDRRQSDIQGMILCCPALVIDGYEQWMFGRKGAPGCWRIGSMQMGRCYCEDVRGYDVYAAMERFEKPVIYFHGTNDEMVPVRYAYEAAKHFPNVRLEILPGAGHMLNYGNEDKLFSGMQELILNPEKFK